MITLTSFFHAKQKENNKHVTDGKRGKAKKNTQPTESARKGETM